MSKIIVLSLAGLVMQVSAIVVQDYSAAEADPSGLNWNYVYNYKGSSAVAVGGGWLLTAAHVADDGGTGSISADGTVYRQQQIVFHPSADLALVRYDQAFPGYYTLYTDAVIADPKLRVLMVGYGTTGGAFDFHWTDSGRDKGTRRWGSQKIDRLATRIYDVGNVTTINTGFWMDFNLVNTMHEAGTGTGDSGGGVFYEDGNVWKLAGVNTERSKIGGEYKATFAIGMTDYADWIAETIPEPYTTSLMGLSTLGLFLVRARERRKKGMIRRVRILRRALYDSFMEVPTRRQYGLRLCQYMVGQARSMNSRVRPVWQQLSLQFRACDKDFWNYMVAVHERRTFRRQAAKAAFKRRALYWLDTCLEHVMK